MKTTGIVRCIDHLGRVVIPKEMCRTLRLNAGDPIEIAMKGDKIVLNKLETSCVFCSSCEDLAPFDDKMICKVCLERLRAL